MAKTANRKRTVIPCSLPGTDWETALDIIVDKTQTSRSEIIRRGLKQQFRQYGIKLTGLSEVREARRPRGDE
jgi:hypothetical protein